MTDIKQDEMLQTAIMRVVRIEADCRSLSRVQRNHPKAAELARRHLDDADALRVVVAALAAAEAREIAIGLERAADIQACQAVETALLGNAYEGMNDDLRADGVRACIAAIRSLPSTPAAFVQEPF